MIRQANKWDILDIVDMLRNYRSETTWPRLKDCNNEQHITTLLTHILAGAGIIFVAERNNTVVGMLAAVKNTSIWDPDLWVMNELCYWVEPEHRGTSAGYRLIKAYTNYCDQLKQQGVIEAYTISKMTNSPDLNYAKFGFEKQEENWRA